MSDSDHANADLLADFSGGLPDPPIEAEVTLLGYTTIDMPMDWHTEEWALPLTDAVLGAMYRLAFKSLRQAPAGSLPASAESCLLLLEGCADRGAVLAALEFWEECSDGRRYWPRLVPVIETAWRRYKGKQSADATRKRRERMGKQLRVLGVTETGAKNRDVLDAVFAQMRQGAPLSITEVRTAAMAAGVIGNIRPLSRVTVTDSHGTAGVTVSDSHAVSGDGRGTRFGGPAG